MVVMGTPGRQSWTWRTEPVEGMETGVTGVPREKGAGTYLRNSELYKFKKIIKSKSQMSSWVR